MKVFDEALMFNYPDMDKKDPNVETDTEESWKFLYRKKNKTLK